MEEKKSYLRNIIDIKNDLSFFTSLQWFDYFTKKILFFNEINTYIESLDSMPFINQFYVEKKHDTFILTQKTLTKSLLQIKFTLQSHIIIMMHRNLETLEKAKLQFQTNHYDLILPLDLLKIILTKRHFPTFLLTIEELLDNYIFILVSLDNYRKNLPYLENIYQIINMEKYSIDLFRFNLEILYELGKNKKS